MNKRLLKNIEWGILICTILLIVIGLVALFSATQNADYDEFKKQIMWVLVSIPVMIVVILIDYEIFVKMSNFVKTLLLTYEFLEYIISVQ